MLTNVCKMKLVAKLPVYEIGAYFVIWFGVVFYSFYNVYKTSTFVKQYTRDEDSFTNTWNYFTNFKKDASDYEWERFLQLLYHITPYFIVNFVISECLRYFKLLKLIPIWQIFIPLLFIYIKCGLPIALIITIQPMLFEIFSKFKMKTLIWICAGVNYCLTNYLEPYITEELSNNEISSDIIVPGIFWIKLRCLSFYLDKMENFNEIEDSTNFLQVLSYCLYLPMLIIGPFISYQDFEKSHFGYNKIRIWKRLSSFILNLMRFLGWLLFLEILLHYTYINNISLHPELVQAMDGWTLYGFGYCMGQFFHIKYVVMYGISTTWAKLENVDVPNTPKCIGRIYLYSDMWKYFDRGLYKFLLKYLYLPTKSTKSILSKLFSSMVCFTFIYVWHGLQKYIFIWAFLNFFGIMVETIAADIYRIYLEKIFNQHLTEEWKRRTICAAASPLLGLSAISNFYFFSDVDVGNIFIYTYFHGSFMWNCILLSVLYCTGQVSVEVKNWERKKDMKSHNQ